VSADRALFDESRESILARKYEASTERSLFRTLREFREVEAAAPKEEAAADPVEGNPCPKEISAELGSSLPESVGAVAENPPSDPPPVRRAIPGRPEGPSGRDPGVGREPMGPR